MVIILNGGGGKRKGKTELSYDPPLPKVTKTGFLTTIPNVFSSQKVRRSKKKPGDILDLKYLIQV